MATKLTPEIVEQKAKQFTSRTEWAKQSHATYRYALKFNLMEKVAPHMVKHTKPLTNPRYSMKLNL